MLDYDTTMRMGAEQYRDVLTALDHAGWTAIFTQTGGMNAAIEITLEGGATLLITNPDDSLSWYRGDLDGWGVGFHVDPDKYEQPERYDGPLAFEQTYDGSAIALLALVDRVIRCGTSELLRRHEASAARHPW